MKLEPLMEMSLAYRGELVLQKSFGASGAGYGEAEGQATGERVRGTVRSSNHPELREDDVFLPNAAGVIATHDGANVLFNVRGYSVRTEPGGMNRAFTVWVAFQSEDARYRWLNTTFAVGEGAIDLATKAFRLRVYACRHEMMPIAAASG